MQVKKFILLLVFLSACMPQTEIVIAENTAVSTQTPEIINTTTPLPTATLSEVDKIFLIPTRDYSSIPTTLTPIIAPNNPSSLQLRALSEKDYIDWINELQRNSFQNYTPRDDWWSDGMFTSSQAPIALAIQEYLFRYPDSSNAARLKWQLAFIDSIATTGGNIYNDKWIVSELEKKLNQGEVSPENLENLLDQYWFDVGYYQTIPNLFNDGKISWFYVIGPQLWADEEGNQKRSDYFSRGGLFIVIREVEKNKFQMYLLESAINFSFADSYIYELSDHNQNGIPEIALYIGSHSGTMCGGNLKIFEWKSTQFVELTKDQILLNDCGESFEYLYRNEISTIQLSKIFPLRTYYYVWDGNYYEFSESSSVSLLYQWKQVFSDSHSTFAEEIIVIEKILDSDTKEGLDNAHIDFLRYRLGVLYALDSKDLIAKEKLQDLIDNPNDKTRPIYSEAANVFLKYYSGSFRINNACQYSRKFFEEKWDNLDNRQVDEMFGVPFDEIFGFADLRCYEWDIFETMIDKTEINKDISIVLSENGLYPHYINKFDINRDGILEEWLILFDGGLYLILPDNEYYKYYKIDLSGRAALGHNVLPIKSTQFFVESSPIPHNTLIISKIDNEVTLIGIDKSYDAQYLYFDYDIQNLVFNFSDTPAKFEVNYIKPEPTQDNYFVTPWVGHRWDFEHLEFKPDLFEYTLFVDEDIAKTIAIADDLWILMNNWRDIGESWRTPRYYYLCALTYELAGDSQKAAEIYYQLWREFPESHYAHLAKFKLEPINP